MRFLFYTALLATSVYCEDHQSEEANGDSLKAAVREKCGEIDPYPYVLKANTTKPPYHSERKVGFKLEGAKVENRCNGVGQIAERLLLTNVHQANADLGWMLEDIEIPMLIYFVNKPAKHNHTGPGNEAMAYLKFMAEYYDCLPNVTLFSHPHRASYHSYQDLDKAIQGVRWEAIESYQTLHPFGGEWLEFGSVPEAELEGNSMQPSNLDEVDCRFVSNGTMYEHRALWNYHRAQWIPRLWDELLEPSGFGPIPSKFRMNAAAEFFATRNIIRSRPRQFYLNAIQWALNIAEKQLMTDWEVDVAFELTWHIIFGKPAVWEGNKKKFCDMYVCEQDKAQSI